MTVTAEAIGPDAPLVVFDFDHTLYDGDSGGDMVQWLLRRSWARALAAIVASVVLLPMLAFVVTRRQGISGYLWLGTFGLHDYRDLNALIRRYVVARKDKLRAALLPIAVGVLERHLAAGDRVVIATGAPPELAHAILEFVAHSDVPVVGSHEAPFMGGLVTIDHCHSDNKLRCLERKGYSGPIAIAYSDSSADLPLLKAARHPVVVNPKPGSIAMFRRVLPAGTPMLDWGSVGRAGDPVAASPQAGS
ncbi:MAG: haloacid dehalogenase [Xanthomonadaceae bacterium]|nr:haloacid dehalogenase [Xanthomonadaceae bacterium]